MDRENNHTAAREVSFIENSASVYLLQSFPEFPYKSFMFTAILRITQLKPHVLMIKLSF